MAEPDGGYVLDKPEGVEMDVLERWAERMKRMNKQTPTDPGDAEVLERWRERLKNIHELCPNIEPDDGVLEEPGEKEKKYPLSDFLERLGILSSRPTDPEGIKKWEENVRISKENRKYRDGLY